MTFRPGYESVQSGQPVIFDIKEIGQIGAANLGPFGVAGLSRMDTSRLARRAHRWPKSGRFGAQNGHRRASPGPELGGPKVGLCLGPHQGRAELMGPKSVAQRHPRITGRRVAARHASQVAVGPFWAPACRPCGGPKSGPKSGPHPLVILTFGGDF